MSRKPKILLILVLFTSIIMADCLLPGDINEDGLVSVMDIVTYICAIQPLPGGMDHNCQDYNADCFDANNDEQIDVLDIVAIVNIILGEE